ncbi:MAG: hypothetical protein ACFCVK_11455 [Acidimicrobiales bacterium]
MELLRNSSGGAVCQGSILAHVLSCGGVSALVTDRSVVVPLDRITKRSR